jgi:hypothetical protein
LEKKHVKLFNHGPAATGASTAGGTDKHGFFEPPLVALKSHESGSRQATKWRPIIAHGFNRGLRHQKFFSLSALGRGPGWVQLLVDSVRSTSVSKK